MRVLAYDPPGENIEEGQIIILDKAVCKLLKIVESLDQFHVLGAEVSTEDGWEWKTVPQISKLRVALPSQYFDFEEKLRTRLGLYFLANESIYKHRESADNTVELATLTIAKKINSHKFEDNSHTLAEEFSHFVLNLKEVNDPTVFLTNCHQYLNLDETLSEFVSASEKVIIQSNLSMSDLNEVKKHDILTSSGMLIREMDY